ncbi:CsiV family protein [Veronia nyctiphanis]|uniref:CsiV family protein n=1 Tax=Veronia nyctiphanis TaxID=1278244 RepID=UPI0022A89338|nr:CsiV family protein [Veronia nyctiphanis]
MKKYFGILLCLLSWSAAAERQFDVEVIVFKRNLSPEVVKESWPEQTPAVDFAGSVSASNSASMLINDLQVLPEALGN